MLLRNHKHVKLYDIRPVINIHHVYHRTDSSLNRLKIITNSTNITFVKETKDSIFDNELHSLPYKVYLCVNREDFNGGLYEFVDKETNHVYTFDMSPGLCVICEPEYVLVRKQYIVNGERTIVLTT